MTPKQKYDERKRLRSERLLREEQRAKDARDRDDGSYILAFAQHDLSASFMDGIHPRHRDYFIKTLEIFLEAKSSELINNYVHDEDEQIVETELQRRDNEKLIKLLQQQHTDFSKKFFSNPIMRVISSLPKEEMCAMAEALVDITGLRRKLDSVLASVSGPIDVAFISKGDGVIWIKRKHYFDIEMNPDFRYRKQRPLPNG